VRRLLIALALALAAAGPSLAAPQTRLADLWLSGRDRPDPARVGHPLAYTVVIRNKGQNAAQGVALSGQVGRVGTATKRALVLLKLKGKGCRNLPGTDSPVIAFACAVRTMAAHTSVVVTATVRPTARGTFRLAAVVSSATRFHSATLRRRHIEIRTTVNRR